MNQLQPNEMNRNAKMHELQYDELRINETKKKRKDFENEPNEQTEESIYINFGTDPNEQTEESV